MGVLRLADYRKPTPQSQMEPAPRFYCLKCDSETFRLLSNGTVHCNTCGARMKNLAVRSS